jgi:hypothetical protein
MKSHKLKDAGKHAFPVLPVAAWSGFGVVDGDHVLEVHVQDCFNGLIRNPRARITQMFSKTKHTGGKY